MLHIKDLHLIHQPFDQVLQDMTFFQ